MRGTVHGIQHGPDYQATESGLGGCLSRKSVGNNKVLWAPRWWFENPSTGLLGTRPYMAGMPYVDVDYCQYCDWGYKKPTRIWADEVPLHNFTPKRCDGVHCKNLDFVAAEALRGQRRHRIILSDKGYSPPTQMKYRVPPALLEDIIVAGEGEDIILDRQVRGNMEQLWEGEEEPWEGE